MDWFYQFLAFKEPCHHFGNSYFEKRSIWWFEMTNHWWTRRLVNRITWQNSLIAPLLSTLAVTFTSCLWSTAKKLQWVERSCLKDWCGLKLWHNHWSSHGPQKWFLVSSEMDGPRDCGPRTSFQPMVYFKVTISITENLNFRDQKMGQRALKRNVSFRSLKTVSTCNPFSRVGTVGYSCTILFIEHLSCFYLIF